MESDPVSSSSQASGGNMWLNLSGEFRFYWVAFLVVLIDQVVKLSIKFNMQLYDEIPIVGDVFRINFIENKGAAFGLTISDVGSRLGISISDETAKLILTLFSILAVTVIIYLLRKVRHYRSALPYFLALILGGAVGNIIDRVFYGVWFAGMNNYEGGLMHGRVVDMFYLNVYQGEMMGQEINLLPVFNVADAAITVGIGAIILFQRRFFRNPPDPVHPAVSKPEPRRVAISPPDSSPEGKAQQSPAPEG